MWTSGEHCKTGSSLPRTNDYLGSIKGDLSTEQAQVAFAQFCCANPSFAAQILTGVNLYPFQDIMLRSMFQKDFFLAICSRGLSKSYTSAMFALLYAIFNPNLKIGICSASFRQSRAVFKQIEDFANAKGGQFLRQCINGRPKHLNDAWEMKLGSSTIVALPLGDGGKIRGYRFNVMIIDELLLLSDAVINEVIRPFMAIQADPRKRQEVKEAEDKLIAAGQLTEEERYQFPRNKLIGLTSASYEFEYLYKLYSSYKDMINDPKEKGVSHSIFQMSYDIAPEGLYDKRMVEDSKKTMSSAQYSREFGAQFTGDSAGYFSAKTMNDRTVQAGQEPHTEIVGDPDAEYILAIDPNYSDSESADHFAMTLLKLNPELGENGGATMVHGYALSKSTLTKRADYIKYLMDNFNIVYAIVDNAGGKKFIQDIDEVKVLDVDKLLMFDHDFDNKNWDEAVSKSRANFRPELGKIVHSQVFTSTWIRDANEYLQVALEQGQLWFASPVDATAEAEYNAQKKASVPIDKLHFSKDEDDDYKGMGKRDKGILKKSDFIEHQGSIVKLTKEETALIVISQSPTGAQRFDLPPELVKQKNAPDRVRRDSYSTLLLAAWGMKCFYALKKLKPKKAGGFRPHFVA